jgi:hypothetical protein
VESRPPRRAALNKCSQVKRLRPLDCPVPLPRP